MEENELYMWHVAPGKGICQGMVLITSVENQEVNQENTHQTSGWFVTSLFKDLLVSVFQDLHQDMV
jgi:hypothetical protein